MSGSNRSFAVVYAFLVILPLVALAGILRAGRGLVAPISIDGTWNVQVDSAMPESKPCGKALAGLLDKTFAVAQSGKTFVVSFPGDAKLTGSGTLEGNALQALLPVANESSSGGCLDQRQLSLVASIERRGKTNLLTGNLSVPSCASCATIGFHAERQIPPAPAKGGH